MASKKKSIVFTGSSIIALWEDLSSYFPGFFVLNTAIGGSQTHDILASLDKLVISNSPDIICYYCGSNDLNNGRTVKAIVENVKTTYDSLRKHLDNPIFIYLSIIKAPQKMDRWDMVDKINAEMSSFEKDLVDFEFIDINPVFFFQDGKPRMDFYQEDQLHLMPAAYAAMGEFLVPRIMARIS